jgi:hypothetical protein
MGAGIAVTIIAPAELPCTHEKTGGLRPFLPAGVEQLADGLVSLNPIEVTLLAQLRITCVVDAQTAASSRLQCPLPKGCVALRADSASEGERLHVQSCCRTIRRQASILIRETTERNQGSLSQCFLETSYSRQTLPITGLEFSRLVRTCRKFSPNHTAIISTPNSTGSSTSGQHTHLKQQSNRAWVGLLVMDLRSRRSSLGCQACRPCSSLG